jgi:hypothetical protein
VHPAGEPDGLADILFPQLATGFAAIGVHGRKDKSEMGGSRRNSAWDSPPCQDKRRFWNKASAAKFIGHAAH